MPKTSVRLAFGKSGLDVELPAERTTVIEPVFEAGDSDPMAVLRGALTEPVAGPRLRDIVRPGQTVAISMCDLTRPQPRALMLSALLDELDGRVRLEDIVVLVATGTHRGNTPEELREMLGDELLNALTVVNHDSRDQGELTWCGTLGDGVPVWLNRHWVAADVRITTGFVEPHFFAGFSGGPKLVAPGLAALETVLTLHDARRIGSSRATWGVIEGNPVHDDVRAIAAATGVDFAFDVTLNRDKQITAAFAGELFAMHAQACLRVRQSAMRAVPELFDVVVTTNAGYPLDQNLYQGIKGMSAAEQIVKQAGVIVLAAECSDGFPDRDTFLEPWVAVSSPQQLLDAISVREHTAPDQWQTQVQARVQARARVYVHTPNIADDDLRAAKLRPAASVAEVVEAELAAAGTGARVCVLPEGPQTIPYLIS